MTKKLSNKLGVFEHYNISSLHYYRLLKSQVKELVIEEMKQLTGNSKNDKL